MRDNRQTHRFQSTLPTRGATLHRTLDCLDVRLFQSTLPTRGATMQRLRSRIAELVSIHAPHTGSDNIGAHLF